MWPENLVHLTAIGVVREPTCAQFARQDELETSDAQGQ